MNRKILVADDVPVNRLLVKHMLESGGYEVLLACDGEEAQEMALREKPALVLMDLSMPKIDGLEATRFILAATLNSPFPILAFTAHAMKEEENKAREAGCLDVVTKPCTRQELLAKVAQWLPKPDLAANQDPLSQEQLHAI